MVEGAGDDFYVHAGAPAAVDSVDACGTRDAHFGCRGVGGFDGRDGADAFAACARELEEVGLMRGGEGEREGLRTPGEVEGDDVLGHGCAG